MGVPDVRFHGAIELVSSLPNSLEPDPARLRVQGPTGPVGEPAGCR